MHALDSVGVNFTTKGDGIPVAARGRFWISRSSEIRFNCEAQASASDATAALADVTAAVAAGEITPDEGASVNGVIAGFLKAVEITDIEKRLAEIERRVAGDGKEVCGAPSQARGAKGGAREE
jgi:hypothetical protein